MASTSEQVVLVTGASQGLGAAIADRLAIAGCRLVLAARGEDALRTMADRLRSHGGEVTAKPGDVSGPGFCRDLVETVLTAHGRLDALVNNAGVLRPLARVGEVDPAAWRYNLAVNLLGPFYLIREALPVLRQSGGRIVNISSGAALRPVAGWSAYCAAKAALTHLTRVLALEEPEVTAVALRPGVVDTDMQTLIRTDGAAAMTPEQMARFQALKEKGNLEPPEVPGRVAAWLALHAPLSWSGELIETNDPRIPAAGDF